MDAVQSFLEGVEQIRRTVGVDSVEVIAGEDDVLMVHPTTGKMIKVGANPSKILKFLLRDFALVLNRHTGLKAKLEIIVDTPLEEEAEVEEEIEKQVQPKRTTVKTKPVKVKRKKRR